MNAPMGLSHGLDQVRRYGNALQDQDLVYARQLLCGSSIRRSGLLASHGRDCRRELRQVSVAQVTPPIGVFRNNDPAERRPDRGNPDRLCRAPLLDVARRRPVRLPLSHLHPAGSFSDLGGRADARGLLCHGGTLVRSSHIVCRPGWGGPAALEAFTRIESR